MSATFTCDACEGRKVLRTGPHSYARCHFCDGVGTVGADTAGIIRWHLWKLRQINEDLDDGGGVA